MPDKTPASNPAAPQRVGELMMRTWFEEWAKYPQLVDFGTDLWSPVDSDSSCQAICRGPDRDNRQTRRWLCTDRKYLPQTLEQVERRQYLKVSSETRNALERSGLKRETRKDFFFCNLSPLQPMQLQSVTKLRSDTKVILMEGTAFCTAILGFSFFFPLFSQLTPTIQKKLRSFYTHTHLEFTFIHHHFHCPPCRYRKALTLQKAYTDIDFKAFD